MGIIGVYGDNWVILGIYGVLWSIFPKKKHFIVMLFPKR